MIIKKYIVSSMREGMDKISKELSPDATIVSSKKIRAKGVAGFFKPKKIEVIAAYDNYDYYHKMNEQNYNQSLVRNNDLLNQIDELKQIVTTLQEEKPSNNFYMNHHNVLSNKIDELMKGHTFSEKVKSQFENYIKMMDYNPLQVNQMILYQFIESEIFRSAKVDHRLEKKVNVFVGPTGVGKTTTLAKVASNEIINHNKKVALITLDTYRIAATEQLKVYASILDIPVSVCYNQDDFQNALEKYSEYDHIFVDTTGRSNNHLAPLEDYLSLIDELNVFLVLTPLINNRDLDKLIETYKVYDFNRIILTKLDESDIHTNIVNILYATDVPISYLCNGQQVPTDISYATKELLLKYAWKRG